MSDEQEVKKLGELVRQIEDYVNKGAWEPQQQEEIVATIARADAIFIQIIDGYSEKTGVPPVQQAYQISDLQERLHRARHHLPSPHPRQEDKDKIMVDKKVVIYTLPT